VRNKSKDQSRIQFALSVAETRNSSDWIDVDTKNLVANFLRAPERSELPKEINESLIVELYSK
jgi:small subunit ribosomal protein S4